MQGATPEVTPTQKMVGPRVDISPGVVRGPEAGRQDCWRCWGLPQGYLTQVEAEAVWSCRPGLSADGDRLLRLQHRRIIQTQELS